MRTRLPSRAWDYVPNYGVDDDLSAQIKKDDSVSQVFVAVAPRGHGSEEKGF